MTDMPDDELMGRLRAASLIRGGRVTSLIRGGRVRSRLTPKQTKAMTMVGVNCEWAEAYLIRFFDFEERGVEVVLPDLRNALRGSEVGVLTMIADMLDPDKPGPWKLELRRNVRGAPSAKYGSYYRRIAMEYFELFEELKEQGVRSPAKEATKRLGAQWKWPPNEIRAAVQWWRKHGVELKRY
jgi:hypothetical protein